MTNHLDVYHHVWYHRTILAALVLVVFRPVHAILFVKAVFAKAAPPSRTYCFCNVLQADQSSWTANTLCAFMLTLQVLDALLMGVSIQTNILSLLQYHVFAVRYVLLGKNGQLWRC